MVTDPHRIVRVSENLAGWWDVTFDDGVRQNLAQYTTEFQAREAGRVNAVRLQADLEIHPGSGPLTYQKFLAETGTLGAPSQR